MKNVLLIKLLACLALLMTLSLTKSILYAKSLKLTFAYTNTNNFPFQIGEGTKINWKKPGIAIEQIVLASKKLKLNIEFIRLPWNRGMNLLKKGEIDGLFSASFKTKRLKYGVYPMKNGIVDQNRQSYSNSYVLYKIKSSPLQWNGESFNHLNKAIGATRGFSIVDDLRKMGVKVEETDNINQDFEKLILGRIEAVAALELAGDYILNANNVKFKNIIKMNPPIKIKSFYLIFSHQFMDRHPKIANMIWENIKLIRTSPKFKQIASKYLE